jgi:tripeptide aminopeptidase
VPDRVIIKGEARSIDPAKLEIQLADMHRCLQTACDDVGAQLTCKTEVEHVGYRVDPQESVVKQVCAACNELKFPVSYTVTGGCSDANVLREHGISALVLGIGMEEVHTTREWISKKNLQDTAALILHLLTRTE